MRFFTSSHSRPVALLLCLSGFTQARSLAKRDDTFDWTNLTASPNLTLTPCYGNLQCARLTVPLQYSDPSAGEAQVAIVVLPSNLSHDDSAYLGPLLFNPGGPGISGVDSVVEDAALFREILGPQYDIVGFDPRGVGHTTPVISLFQSPAEALEFFAPYPQNANESISSLGRIVAQAQILGDLANARAKTVVESVSTPTVATDMLTITRAFGRDKLSYYGISYGSLLGATFAAMFPDQVGRLVIDGIINAHDWYQGTYFAKDSLLDTDAALESVYEACVAAGPSLCPIFENSTDLVRARVNQLISNIHLAPVALFNSSGTTGNVFGVVDYTVVVQQLLGMLDSPYTDALGFMQAVVQLEQGDGTLMFQGTDTQNIDMLATCTFDSSEPFSVGFIDVEGAIECGDSIVDTRRTLEAARAEYESMLEMSSLATAWYPLTQGICAGWSIRGKDHLNGSFETNTSFPLLLIGNTFDPATPIENAHNMSAGFVGSVVLQQNSTGHTSQSGLSTCTGLAVNAYFNNGTLPHSGTVCQIEAEIFGPPAGGSSNVSLAARGQGLGVSARALMRKKVTSRSTFGGRAT
ncbi:uncharacterized protein PHACADRAFT_212992 [Phanerochaete carnosa HHB-10118-sp]|uniref:Peptidase S33 tripeptidyl aminopeptidase-like C-terminal domain-containing protein n=1 Tax=Phanerochaete carnosa (strain HHB-10118-sp) TaxID=650164 RepID=K5WLC2_PHACS|nr:uncharacterized protein PHACADRAFT_212992 [Phanerochaete carnosa HHB-10118-sp]EKM51092.1 hypothetical protein PHACADRAFT_212992 [Phanerochaete carnosa HHB-10118-sp]